MARKTSSSNGGGVQRSRRERASAGSNGSASSARGGGVSGFKEELWASADKLRGNLDAAEYKHVVLGLIFLKYISDAFDHLHAKLAADRHSDPEDRDEYLAENVFWVPESARWKRCRPNRSNQRSAR